MPTAGHRDSNITLRYQTRWGISAPDDSTRLIARSRANSNAIRLNRVRRPQRLIAEPNTKMRTSIRAAKTKRNRMAATTRFFSLLNSACWKAEDTLHISLIHLFLVGSTWAT